MSKKIFLLDLGIILSGCIKRQETASNEKSVRGLGKGAGKLTDEALDLLGIKGLDELPYGARRVVEIFEQPTVSKSDVDEIFAIIPNIKFIL